MEPSSLLVLMLPLATLIASPDSSSLALVETDAVAFGRVAEMIQSNVRVEELHANRLRLGRHVSLGGLFNPFDPAEDRIYTLDIRVTF